MKRRRILIALRAVIIGSAAEGLSWETLIKSLSDFTLEILCIARNSLTRIASYLRKAMTKLCIKILVKSDSAIGSAFPLNYCQYHIDTGTETTPWCYVFLLSHIFRLAVCKKDFSLRSK